MLECAATWAGAGSHGRARAQLLLIGLLASQAALGLSHPQDLTGASDFADLPRYPGAWISAARSGPEVARSFVLGPVERKRRAVRIKAFRRITASVVSLTYELPREVSLRELLEHYRAILSGKLVYSCEGRDCGRSNDWANTVFENANLYGPDAQQRYLAADLGDSLLAVYLIRRGNQRVFAHLLRYTPTEPVHLLADPGELEELLLFGRYSLDRVRPDAGGALADADVAWLQQAGERLAKLPVPALFVVCHLYPPRRPAAPAERRPRRPTIPDRSDAVLALVERSQACAVAVANALTREDGPKLLPFGVGPLAPRGPSPRSHIELILPALD